MNDIRNYAKDIIYQYENAAKIYGKSQILAESLNQYQTAFKISKDRFNMVANKIKKDCCDPIEKAEGTPIKDGLISTLPLDAMLRDLDESYTESKKSSCNLSESLRSTKKTEIEIETNTDIKSEAQLHCSLVWIPIHWDQDLFCE